MGAACLVRGSVLLSLLAFPNWGERRGKREKHPVFAAAVSLDPSWLTLPVSGWRLAHLRSPVVRRADYLKAP